MNKKQIIYSIIIVLFFTSCVNKDKTQNLENFLRTSTLFNKINRNSIQILNSKMLIDESDITGYWVPQENDIAQSLKILESYLQNPKKEYDRKDDKDQIINNIANFEFQVIGILKGDKKIIYLNAFPNTYPQEDRKNIIFVFDGGWKYWQSEINLTNGEIEYFSINGYA